MASILSMAASSPLQEPCNPHTHSSLRPSCSSVHSIGSTGTVQHHRLRSLSSSGSSLSSLTSLWGPAFRRNHDSTPSRSSSSHNRTLRRITTTSDRRSASGSYSKRASFGSVISSRLRSEPTLGSEANEQKLLDIVEIDYEIQEASEDANSLTEEESTFHTTIERLPTVEVDLSLNRLPSPEPELPTASTTDDEAVESSEQPRLRRWISTLRRRKKQLPAPVAPPDAHQWNCGSRSSSPMKRVPSQHKHSNSYGSSLGFVTAVRSATATIASASIATVSRRNTKWRRGHQRSSLLSGSDQRPSVESQRSVLDEAAKQRSRKRRAKLEELIRSEESYVADVKSLSNVCCAV